MFFVFQPLRSYVGGDGSASGVHVGWAFSSFLHSVHLAIISHGRREGYNGYSTPHPNRWFPPAKSLTRSTRTFRTTIPRLHFYPSLLWRYHLIARHHGFSVSPAGQPRCANAFSGMASSAYGASADLQRPRRRWGNVHSTHSTSASSNNSCSCS